MLTGRPTVAPIGVRGFDTNTVVTPGAAATFHRAGYRVALRYVRREPRHDYDISASEASVILSAKLALGIVQHVAPEDWVPSGDLGRRYGMNAAAESAKIGLPVGVNVWCDLEGVKLGTPAASVIAFLQEWWRAVAHVGYLPGLYVGWHAGLGAEQLFRDTPFQYYWAAYNLNRDQYPATRGVCMQQGTEQTLAGIRFDPDVCGRDALGNSPTFLAPEGWPEV